MRVLDLCSGLNGWTAYARANGHECFGIDVDPKLPAEGHLSVLDLTADDVRDLTGWDRPDVILASPPCTAFSVASCSHHWSHPDAQTYLPKSDDAWLGQALVRQVDRLIEDLRPTYGSAVENPTGMLRKMGLLPSEALRPVWACHYGNSSAKPTDVWVRGPLAGLWVPEPPCHNRRASCPPGCCCQDHEAASRGSQSGTQGVTARDGYSAANWRSVVAPGLGEAIMRAAEQAAADSRWGH